MSEDSVQAALDANSTLIARISAVSGRIGKIPKTGRNTFHGYDYSTKDDIAAALNPITADLGIAIIPQLVERGMEAAGTTKSGNQIYRHWAKWNMIVGCETGAINAPWESESYDTDDKGLQKLITNAVRTFRVALFNIPSGDPDGEHDSTPMTAAGSEVASERARPRGGVSAKALLDLVQAEDIPKASQQWALQKEGVPVDTLYKDMTPDQRKAVMARLRFWIEKRKKRDPNTGQPLEAAPADEPQPDQPTAFKPEEAFNPPVDDGIPGQTEENLFPDEPDDDEPSFLRDPG